MTDNRDGQGDRSIAEIYPVTASKQGNKSLLKFKHLNIIDSHFKKEYNFYVWESTTREENEVSVYL